VNRAVAALPAQLHRGQQTPRTVADALQIAASAATRHDVLQAFVRSADTALRVIGVITLIAGALVTVQSAWSTRTRSG
jgi:hypothetical protein